MNPVDNRCLKVDVFVVRNVIEKRLFGSDGKRRDDLASTSVDAKVFDVVNNVATHGNESKSRVDVFLTAVRFCSSGYHATFFESDQDTKVSKMYFVFAGVNPTRIVVSVLFQTYAFQSQSFHNHIKRAISHSKLENGFSSVCFDQSDFVVVVMSVFESPKDRNVVDHNFRIYICFDKTVEVNFVLSVFQPRGNFFHRLFLKINET